MTTRIKIAAAEVQLGDLIYNGLGTSKHPTDTWETITQINVVDGLILFSVVRRLPNRADAGRPHRGRRAGVGQSPREETAECCEAVRVSDALWGFDRRGVVAKR